MVGSAKLQPFSGCDLNSKKWTCKDASEWKYTVCGYINDSSINQKKYDESKQLLHSILVWCNLLHFQSNTN